MHVYFYIYEVGAGNETAKLMDPTHPKLTLKKSRGQPRPATIIPPPTVLNSAYPLPDFKK